MGTWDGAVLLKAQRHVESSLAREPCLPVSPLPPLLPEQIALLHWEAGGKEGKKGKIRKAKMVN